MDDDINRPHRRFAYRVSPSCRRSSQTLSSDSKQTRTNLMPSVATAAVPSSHQPTARPQPSRQLGQAQAGGDKRPVSLGGGVQRVPRAVAVAAAAVAEVGGPLQPVGVLLGVEAQVLGHPPQQGHGAPLAMQGRMHGVQEAADGAQAVQHKTPAPAGVVLIRRHRAAGTCDAYCERGCDLILFTMISGFHLRKAARPENNKAEYNIANHGWAARSTFCMQNMSFRNTRFRKGR